MAAVKAPHRGSGFGQTGQASASRSRRSAVIPGAPDSARCRGDGGILVRDGFVAAHGHRRAVLGLVTVVAVGHAESRPPRYSDIWAGRPGARRAVAGAKCDGSRSTIQGARRSCRPHDHVTRVSLWAGRAGASYSAGSHLRRQQERAGRARGLRGSALRHITAYLRQAVVECDPTGAYPYWRGRLAGIGSTMRRADQ
jgi:hypothetical protein